MEMPELGEGAGKGGRQREKDGQHQQELSVLLEFLAEMPNCRNGLLGKPWKVILSPRWNSQGGADLPELS